MGHAGMGIGWVKQGWEGSCRGRVGHARMVWGGSYRGKVGHAGWDMVGHIRVGCLGNYRVLNLEMPQGIKSDKTIMELQVIESVTPKY